VNYLPQILDSLPLPYTQAGDSVLASIVKLAALEFEAFQEDLDRIRQTHWIQTAYSLKGAPLGALLNIAPFPRISRTLPASPARAGRGATAGRAGPNEVRQFATTTSRTANACWAPHSCRAADRHAEPSL
jgi:hypothetical protein